jgi:hypothetical protein
MVGEAAGCSARKENEKGKKVWWAGTGKTLVGAAGDIYTNQNLLLLFLPLSGQVLRH